MTKNLLRLVFLVGLTGSTLFSQVIAAEPKCFVVNEIQVLDADKYKVFSEQVPATLNTFGGSFIVRGGATEVISGAVVSGRVVIIEFPSCQNAVAWRDSPDYQRIMAIRNESSISRVYLVTGVSDGGL